MSNDIELGENGVPLSFSQRMGLVPKAKAIQIDSMDENLSNLLWSTLYVDCIELFGVRNDFGPNHVNKSFAYAIWIDYFKKPAHRTPITHTEFKKFLITEWKNMEWHKKYSFIEFIVQILPHNSKNINRSEIIYSINSILKNEYSGFRLVDNIFIPLTNQTEISSIESAVTQSESSASAHFTLALEHISRRESPDYLNSIKESISAVEAAIKTHLGKPTGSLGALLGKLPENLNVPTPLVEGWKKLYGWTSGPNGIRHSQSKGEMKPDFAEAQYMLVTCSAFVNYLKLKFAEK